MKGHFHRASIRRGSLPTLPLLPKSGGMYKVLIQPNIPSRWKIASVNFVGQIARCTFVRRQFSPPFEPEYTLLLDGGEFGMITWQFIESHLEKVEQP